MTLMLAKLKKRYRNLLPTTCCKFSSPCYTNQHLILYCNRTATHIQHGMENNISYCVFLFDWEVIIGNLTGLRRTRLKRLHDLWCQKVLKLKEKSDTFHFVMKFTFSVNWSRIWLNDCISLHTNPFPILF